MKPVRYSKQVFKFCYGHRPYKLTFWNRVRLYFRPMQVTIDFGYRRCDPSVAVYFKEMDGKIYVLGEKGRL